MEPWGRIGIGICELITSILILIPFTTGIGALGAIGLMIGALSFHLTKLGINVQGDGGTLFSLALIVLVVCIILVWINADQILAIIKKIIH